MRRAISVEHRVAITLWRLATNIDLRTLGHLFGVGKSTCCVIVQETCLAIKETLMAKKIQIPARTRMQVLYTDPEHSYVNKLCYLGEIMTSINQLYDCLFPDLYMLH